MRDDRAHRPSALPWLLIALVSVTVLIFVYLLGGRIVDWSAGLAERGSSFGGVAALDARHAWAVGTDGSIYFRDGRSWERQDSGTERSLIGVAAADPDHAWAVYDNGVLTFDGKSWSADAGLRGASGLRAVCAADASHVWVVGVSGLILFFDGESWSRQESGVDWGLASVCSAGPDRAWAVGEGGILAFDGQTWRREWSSGDSGVSARLTGVTASDAGDAWAVGFSADTTYLPVSVFLQRVGGSWFVAHREPDMRFTLVHIDAESRLWAAGSGYALVKYQDGAWSRPLEHSEELDYFTTYGIDSGGGTLLMAGNLAATGGMTFASVFEMEDGSWKMTGFPGAGK
ncbi:MAG: hypothetical protein V1748_00655 [Actinomycetota bacterium]